MTGYIKLHRGIKKKTVWRDLFASRLFLNCIMEATHTARVIDGIQLKRGQLLRAYSKLAEEIAYQDKGHLVTPSLSTIERCIKALVKDKRIIVEKSSRADKTSLITVINYDLYNPPKDPPPLNTTTPNRSRGEGDPKQYKNGEEGFNNSGSLLVNIKTSSQKEVFKKVLEPNWLPMEERCKLLEAEGYPLAEVLKLVPKFIEHTNKRGEKLPNPGASFAAFVHHSKYTHPDKRPFEVQLCVSERIKHKDGKTYAGSDFYPAGDRIVHKRAGFELKAKEMEILKP